MPSRLPVLLGAVLLAVACSPEREAERLTVFAAASLSEVAAELAAAFEERAAAEVGRPVEVELGVAGSNVLARQIEAAPAADVFLSADGRWVDVLEAAGRTVAGTRRPFLGNELVLVARPDAPVGGAGAGEDGFDPRRLAEVPFRHLAVADPEAVPAGRYARAALELLETAGGDPVWERVAPRVVPTADVRAALALAESDPRILAVVYRTDAATSERVRVVAALPAPPEEPIAYWAVAVEDGPRPELGRRFLDFLATREARQIVERHGFEALGGEAAGPAVPAVPAVREERSGSAFGQAAGEPASDARGDGERAGSGRPRERDGR